MIVKDTESFENNLIYCLKPLFLPISDLIMGLL